MQDVAGSREARQLRLQHCEAEIINAVLLLNGKGSVISRRLWDDAFQVRAGTIAKENLLLFDIFQAVTHLGVDSGLQLREVIQDLFGRLEHVRDGGDRRDLRGKLNIAVRLGGAFRHDFRRIGESGLLHPEDGRCRCAARRDQIADEKALLWCGVDTRQTLRFNHAGGNISGNQRGVHRHADALTAFNACRERFQCFAADDGLADGLDHFCRVGQRHLSNLLLKFAERRLQRFFSIFQGVKFHCHFVDGVFGFR